MWLSLMRLTVSWLLSLGSSPTLLYAHVASAKSTVLSAKGYERIAFSSCATGPNMLVHPPPLENASSWGGFCAYYFFMVFHVSWHEWQATTDQFVSPCLHLETQTKCHLHGSLSGVSNAPPLLCNQKTPAWPPKTLFLVKKGDLHAPLDSRAQQNGPLHGPLFAQKHPYMRRCSTPPSTPPKLLHRSHECPPVFLPNLRRKKQNEHLEHPSKAGQPFS